MKQIFILLIRCYQLLISPLLGRNCRFVPSCSEFASQALAEHGLFKGMFLSIKRIGSCHPWSKRSHCDLP